MNWKRTLGWSLLILTAAVVVGQAFGPGTLSIVGIFISSTTLYCFYLRPLKVKRVKNLIAAFLLVTAIDWTLAWMIGASLTHMLSNLGSDARHLGAALLGLILASLSSNNSFKPNPLRGSA